MNLHLKNKKVLITGSSKGIGFEMAKAFVKEGAEVGIVGRSLQSLKEAKMKLDNKVSIYSIDVTSENEREKLISNYIKDYGSIDVLINNAGGSNGGKPSQTTMEEYYNAFELNFFSAVELSKLAINYMKENKEGSIINITSVFGRESGGSSSYNSSKAALISFTKSLADEVISKGIRVNSIAPGSILHETGNWKKRLEKEPDKIKKFVENEIPAGRFGTPDEIADIALFLASKRSSWVVGSSINVDGGQSRMNF